MRRIVRHPLTVRHGLNGRDSKLDVTAATPLPMVIRRTHIDHYRLVGP
jgi:hypothetical protein